jgi:hypothetical protein
MNNNIEGIHNNVVSLFGVSIEDGEALDAAAIARLN